MNVSFIVDTKGKNMAKGIAPAAAVAAWFVAAATLLGTTPASAASLVEISGFGQNPTNLRMHVYAPDNRPVPPPILVAIHYCTGSGPTFFNNTEFRTLADQYGFMVIYPSATRSGQCFDVSSQQALRRNGGSDPVGIMSMVTYVIQSYGADASRVYVTGASSGAMMTNVMIGNYPDVFKAGAAFMGVPHSCFATTDGSMWNTQCANGQRIMTAQQWGDLARNAFPGFSGTRPRMQLWHGTTDATLRYPNFGEEIKQWTNVLGLSQTPSSTDTPQSGWTRTRYGGTGVNAPVEGISVANVGHSLPLAGQARMAIQFFGLDSSGPPQPPGSTVWLEAERGTVGANWNDNVADSTASSGQYVVAPSVQSLASAPATSAGWVQLPFNAPAAGTYNVWFRKKTPTADDDSFWLRTDNGSWTLWNNMGSSSSWVWVKAPVTYNLSAGSHTFYVGLRENGSQLDKVYLTTGNDTPTGTGGTPGN
jgi:poly(hydroxyalkanoate) depolymerase family esterase